MDHIDWTGHWKALVEGREVQADRIRARQEPLSSARGATGGSYWDQRAAGFREGVQGRVEETDQVIALIAPYLTPQSTVLDVGAGVGRYAIPLAPRVERVIAVEPSGGMRRFMEEDARAAGVHNIAVVPSTWEQASVEPCDVVLCSHVVYFISNIRAFLEKVSGVCRGQCFMAIRTNQRDAPLRVLWELIHKEPRVPEPGLIDLYNVIHQVLGVCAHVQVVTYRSGRNALGLFGSVNDALPEVRRQLLIAEGSPEEEEARRYLEDRMVREDGKLALPGPGVSNAVVWWDNRPGSVNFVR